MAQRSWLFVPEYSEKKLGKANATGADAIIVDLEDLVTSENKARARGLACEWLAAHRRQVTQDRRIARWVRINVLDSRMWRDDLVAVMPGAPDGRRRPKSAGPELVQQLAAELLRAGTEERDSDRHHAGVLPLVSETAAAALTIPAYATASLPRLAGLTWGAEDLSAAIGASRKREKDGRWTDAFRLPVPSALTAHACGVAAIDTLHADFADAKGLKRAAEEARADGFSGMLAIHPAQVEVINQASPPARNWPRPARSLRRSPPIPARVRCRSTGE